MAYQNFVPEVWEDAIQRQLTRNHILVGDCYQKYTGKVKQRGDSVRILGIGKPTITTVGAKDFKGLDKPETIEDSSTLMYIDQLSHFNFMVGDIDEIQAVDGVMDALNEEASEGIADVQDRFVAAMAADKQAVKLSASPIELTKDNILEQFDLGLQKLWENDVKRSTKIIININPAVERIFKQAFIAKDTDNSDILANGAHYKYGGAYIKVTNNLYTSGANNAASIMFRTQRAIAFACPKVHVEAYRPESDFADAVKGFALYGGKIVRPKELIVLNGYVA